MKKLIKLIRDNGYKNTDLFAQEIDVSAGAVRKWADGAEPVLSRGIKACKVLKITPEEFLKIIKTND